MGKVKAKELKDVHVNFVSFVTEGANGETFTIFKCAKPGKGPAEKAKTAAPETPADAKTGEEKIMDPKEKAALEKAEKDVEALAKANAELSAKLAKAEEALAVSQKSFADLTARVDAVEKIVKEATETNEDAPAGTESEKPTGNTDDLKALVSSILEKIEKLSGQKREPAGKSTEEGAPAGSTADPFAGVFFPRKA